MDEIEKCRTQRPQTFIDLLGLEYNDKWKSFFKDYGIKVTEEIKMIEDDE